MQTLEQRSLMAAQPVITEFMAKNGVTLKDGFGQNNDWIEITNQGDASIDLAGWHLTDSTNLSKWTFPTFALAAGQSKVVFASSLDTTDPAGNLHTNFSLSQDGEKLALTRPDLSIASRFNADGTNYPAQLNDVSYGTGTIYDNSTLVGPRMPMKAFVPVNGTLDNNAWTANNYNDASWLSGNGGVGFDTGGYEDETLAPTIVGNWTADALSSSLTNGAVLNSWTDSVQGATAIKSGTPTYLSGAINGHSVIHFDNAAGVNDLLRVPAARSPMSGKEDFTVTVVWRAAAGAGIGSSGGQWTANAGLVDASVNGTTNDWGISVSQTSGGRVLAGTGAPDTTIFTAGNKVNGAAHIIVFTRKDNVLYLYIDGGDPVVANASDIARGMTDMVFGGLQTNNNFFLGDIAEVGVYGGAMTASQAYKASSDLGTKYAIAVTAPTNTLGATLAGDWVADSLNSLSDNAAVTTWGSSVGSHNATASGLPRLVKSQLNGHSVVRFNPSDGNDNLRVASGVNPISGAGDFSMAVVFRSGTNGVGDAGQWYNNTGIVDGELGGVTDDWGLALNGSGQLGAGIGNPDATMYSAGGNANGVAHVAIYTKSGDTYRLTIDGGEPYEGTAPTGNRTAEDMVFGSIQTNINYFTGDIAEVRAYTGALDIDAEHALCGTLANTYGIAVAADRYDPYIGIQLQTQMFNVATTALIRVPFTVDDPSLFDKLTLSMQYDDGFVAYLNGTEIARRNASGTITYTSTSSTRRLDNDAVSVESIDVTAFKGLLLGGGATNVLAIRALNSSISDPDLLIIPQLIGSKTTTGPAYMSTPTPGAPNGQGYAGFVPDLTISKPHGVYTTAFALTVSTTATGVTLVYTLDGSEPSLTNGVIVAPTSASTLNSFTLNVNKSTTLRVVGFKNTFLPSAVSTNTYIFPSSVLTQGNTQPVGAYWDTEVDPDVVNASQTYSVTQALTALPSLSLVLPYEDIFGSTGIYKNPSQKGDAWERETSIEYFDPNDASLQFQIDAGLRIEGGSIRDTGRPKKSFRLYFRNQYGNGKLDQPLFGASNPQQSFDHLTLKAGNNNTWANEPGTNGDYIRDEYSQVLQQSVNGYSAAGKWVQLYINGQYWGVYNVSEDVDSTWAAANFGGSNDNYDVLEPDHNGGLEVQDGTSNAYDDLFTTADSYIASGGTIDNTEYAALSQLVDVDKLAGYMLSTLYRADKDSPVLIGSTTDPRNFYAVRRNDIAGKVIFQTWDGELAMDDVNLDRTEVLGNKTPSRLFNQLRTNPEFQQLVTDKLFTLLHNGGPLEVRSGVNKPVDLYNTLVNKLNVAIVGESARWGDAHRAVPYTRDVDWLNAINWMRGTFLAQRTGVFTTQEQADFPASARLPASFMVNGVASHGGATPAGATLTLSNPNPTAGDAIYYTLDGTDPRLAGGGVSSSALVYSTGIALSGTKTVTVRTLNAGVWTASDRAVFVAAVNGLRVSELAYQPTVPAGGTYSAGEYEFIEVVNTGAAALDISGTYFKDGITFTVAANTSLAAGEYAVIVKNALAFPQAFPSGVRVLGQYSGSLANEGELITDFDAAGTPLQSFTYGGTWYPVAAGGGHSLVIRNLSADKTTWSDQNAWRPSQLVGGSPGALDVDLAPTVTITPVTPNVRNTTVASIPIAFSEPVTGFDLAHLSLTRAGGANLLTSSQTLASTDGGKTWTLGNLAGLMTVDGTYTLLLSAAGVADLTAHPLAAAANAVFTIDRAAPTVTSSEFLVTGANPQVRFSFNESLLAGAATPVMTLTRVGGTATTVTAYSIVGNTIVFDLPPTLGDSNYNAVLTVAGVRDAAGNSSASGNTLAFGFLAGDFNSDHIVNFDDLIILAQNYNKTGLSYAQGNANFSAGGEVNFDDLIILAQRYNQSLPAALMSNPSLDVAPASAKKKTSPGSAVSRVM